MYFEFHSFHHFSYTKMCSGLLKICLFTDGLNFHTFSINKYTVLYFSNEQAYPIGNVLLKKTKIDDVVKLQLFIREEIYIFFCIIHKLVNHCWQIRWKDRINLLLYKFFIKIILFQHALNFFFITPLFIYAKRNLSKMNYLFFIV